MGPRARRTAGPTLAQLLVTRGGRDVTADPVPGVRFADLDPAQVRRLRQTIVSGAEQRNLAGVGDRELLEALGLTLGPDVTLAAVLLFGNRPTLARYGPRPELTFTRRQSAAGYGVRRDLRGPLLEVLDNVQRLLDANLRVSTADVSGFQQVELPDISWWVAREAVLNALVHRDYFLHQSIHLTLHDGRAEITSPGGFTGGVTARNVLRHPPARRNPLLADVLQAIGLVNRAGLGVDRIYEELLLLGKDLPRYDADESHVRLVLPTRTHAHFVRFVHEVRRGGGVFGLDDLILLAGSRDAGHWTAGPRPSCFSSRKARRRPGSSCSASEATWLRGAEVAAPTIRLARRHAGLVDAVVPTEDDARVDEESVRLRLIALVIKEMNRDGEAVTVTNRGRPVAVLSTVPASEETHSAFVGMMVSVASGRL